MTSYNWCGNHGWSPRPVGRQKRNDLISKLFASQGFYSRCSSICVTLKHKLTGLTPGTSMYVVVPRLDRPVKTEACTHNHVICLYIIFDPRYDRDVRNGILHDFIAHTCYSRGGGFPMQYRL